MVSATDVFHHVQPTLIKLTLLHLSPNPPKDGSVLVRLGIRGHGNGRHGSDPD